MKRILCCLLCLLMLVGTVSCSVNLSGAGEGSGTTAETDTELQTLPEGFSAADIGERSLYLFVGDSYTLHYSVIGENPDPQKIAWSSSSDCVTLDGAHIKAEKEGFAVISAGGSSACVVKVLPRQMPTLSIDTNGASITSKETYVPCQIGVQTENADYCFASADAGIRLRGNSSSNNPKRPYRIKFESARNLLGMNQGAKCKSWVLLAERYDDSMVHNTTALSLASMILTEYTSDWRYVTVYLNGQYWGVYLLAEQSQIHKHRVNIEEAGEDSSALKSGYMFEMDRASENPIFKIYASRYNFTNFLGEVHNCKDLVFGLKNNGLSEGQKIFAEKYYKNVYQILYSATYENIYYEFDSNFDLKYSNKTSAREVIEAVIDVDSLVRKYIHSEIVCNSDDHQRSYYTHVDLSANGTGLLTFSCPWDYDYAFSDSMTKLYHDPEAYFAARRTVWYVMIMNHEWFREMVTDYWNGLYEDTDGFAVILETMQAITETYQEDFDKDRQRWQRDHDQAEQAQIMYEWVTTRINWLNERFGKSDFFTVTKE